MNKKFLTLAGRIREEISEMETIFVRTQKGWELAKQSGDELYLDSVALNLHSFYTALERVFELIVTTIDQDKPLGENWHRELLLQMAAEIKLIRPAVISKETRNGLDEYRGFRHVVRNVYSFNLSSTRIEPLVRKLPSLFTGIKSELEGFAVFLDAQGKHIR